MGFRLTAHIEKAPDIIDEKNEKKKGIKNTISIRNIPTHKQVEEELLKLKEKYSIAKGKNSKKMNKYGNELIYISNEK
jgi:hypothetical protein